MIFGSLTLTMATMVTLAPTTVATVTTVAVSMSPNARDRHHHCHHCHGATVPTTENQQAVPRKQRFAEATPATCRPRRPPSLPRRQMRPEMRRLPSPARPVWRALGADVTEPKD
jgi:hypothetical protein